MRTTASSGGAALVLKGWGKCKGATYARSAALRRSGPLTAQAQQPERKRRVGVLTRSNRDCENSIGPRRRVTPAQLCRGP
jgi:hypothetical protein